MADGDSPVVQGRRLAKELRRLRTDAGLTVQEVASKLECSPGKISRIETASVGARIGDVRDLLDLYDVDGDHRERILQLVRLSHRRSSWWHEYAGALPQEATRFLGMEDGAATIDDYSGNLIPGLLQDDGYSHALISTARDRTTTSLNDTLTLERRTILRRRRQDLLTREGAPTVRFVFNEAALAVRFGGADSMAKQLDRLLTVGGRPNVTIRVLPLATDAFAAAGGMFTIFRFADPAVDPPIVYYDTRTKGHFCDIPEEVNVYEADFDEVLGKALSPKRSRDVIKHWATQHRDAA